MISGTFAKGAILTFDDAVRSAVIVKLYQDLRDVEKMLQ